MKSFGASFLLSFCLISVNLTAQRLTKADRQIVSNLKTHTARLSAAETAQLAQHYTSDQFQRLGIRPRLEQFEIYDGKELPESNYFNINNQALRLYEDYFPFPFSGNGSIQAVVALALAENGNPWFKDLRDIVGEDHSEADHLAALVREGAARAAEKGAAMLIIYSKSGREPAYDSMDRSKALPIPVVFLKNQAYEKYCSDESSVLDIDIHVELKEKKHSGTDIHAFADNGADSTLTITASFQQKKSVAALIELARLSRSIKPRNRNYLFTALSPGRAGFATPFLALDSIRDTDKNDNGLYLVKKSIEALKNH